MHGASAAATVIINRFMSVASRTCGGRSGDLARGEQERVLNLVDRVIALERTTLLEEGSDLVQPFAQELHREISPRSRAFPGFVAGSGRRRSCCGTRRCRGRDPLRRVRGRRAISALLEIADHHRTQQEGRQHVEGHDPLVGAHRHHRPQRAVQRGRHRVFLHAEQLRGEQPEHREPVLAGCEPSQELSFAIFGDHADLAVESAEEAEDVAVGLLAREHVPGDQSDLDVRLRGVAGDVLGGCTEPCPHQRRVARPADRRRRSRDRRRARRSRTGGRWRPRPDNRCARPFACGSRA